MCPISQCKSYVLSLSAMIGLVGLGVAQETGPKTAADPAYVQWLEAHSMLAQARKQAELISGKGVQWRHEYGSPEPRQVVKKASVWLLDYPGSVITPPDKSVIETWGNPQLWEALEKIGIDLLHTGPIKEAGGIRRRERTPTIDGWFDPISLEIDSALGTEREYKELVQTAARHGGTIAGDLVPLHTGMGADFRLALQAYKDYPGMYTLVEIRQADWNLLPDVEGIWSTEFVPKEAAVQLHAKGYIPGLIHSNDAAPEARELSGWSATGEIPGVDGNKRRWVYLHYFKKEQPTLNWLDPSSAGQRAIAGDVVKNIHTLGTGILRLDAVPFLGIEPHRGEPLARHFKHPLSVQGTNSIAFLIRKLGGHSFHELNIPLRELKAFTEHGPDLSYDFFTRAQCLHALLTQDAALLRQSFQFLLDADVQPISLVHDLQNHDEITYQLVELDARGDERFTIHGEKTSGKQLREKMLKEMREAVAGERAPHNKLYRPGQDGVATTFAGFIAAALDIRDPYHATREERARIQRAHLLLAGANALQPGVFSLSSWDLVGALPIPERSVADRMQDGDFRWINRGGVDLMHSNPEAKSSQFGIERAPSLYGSLPAQLADPNSFVAQLRELLRARKKYRLAEGTLWAVPEVQNRAVCLLVMRVSDDERIAVTALNFSQEPASEDVDLSLLKLPAEKRTGTLWDILAEEKRGDVSANGRCTLELPALSARTWVIQPTRK